MDEQPYHDEKHDGYTIRTFMKAVPESELVWHRDHANRTIVPVECDGWMFQEDNKLPEKMEPNKAFVIEAGVYHRIIKGSGKLKLKIIEGK